MRVSPFIAAFVALLIAVSPAWGVATRANAEAKANAKVNQQIAAEQARLEQRAQKHMSERAHKAVRNKAPLDPKWQKAVDDAKTPDFGSIFGSRMIALMLGSLWLGLLFRRWKSQRGRVRA